MIHNKNKNSLNKIKFKITKSLVVLVVGKSDTPNMVGQICSKGMVFLRISDFSNIYRGLFVTDLCFDFIWLVIATTNGIVFIFEYHIV